MSTAWAAFAEFWQTWGPWIGTALIPTIIVGLSVSPKTVDAAGYVQKAWDIIKMILDALSVVSHKDKPGTFQLPFKMNALVAKKEPTDGAPPAGPVLVLIFVVGSSYSQTGCSWWKTESTNVKRTVIDCSVASVQENASHLVPAIIGILSGGAVNWKDQVKVFVKEFGRDATACALQAATQRLNDPVQSEPEEDPYTTRQRAINRSDLFRSEQGWTFAH